MNTWSLLTNRNRAMIIILIVSFWKRVLNITLIGIRWGWGRGVIRESDHKFWSPRERRNGVSIQDDNESVIFQFRQIIGELCVLIFLSLRAAKFASPTMKGITWQCAFESRNVRVSRIATSHTGSSQRGRSDMKFFTKTAYFDVYFVTF